jgi:hypothetical protein
MTKGESVSCFVSAHAASSKQQSKAGSERMMEKGVRTCAIGFDFQLVGVHSPFSPSTPSSAISMESPFFGGRAGASGAEDIKRS